MGVKENDNRALALVDLMLFSTCACTGEGNAGVSMIVSMERSLHPIEEWQ